MMIKWFRTSSLSIKNSPPVPSSLDSGSIRGPLRAVHSSRVVHLGCSTCHVIRGPLSRCDFAAPKNQEHTSYEHAGEASADKDSSWKKEATHRQDAAMALQPDAEALGGKNSWFAVGGGGGGGRGIRLDLSKVRFLSEMTFR
jgi:hypothetical protein